MYKANTEIHLGMSCLDYEKVSLNSKDILHQFCLKTKAFLSTIALNIVQIIYKQALWHNIFRSLKESKIEYKITALTLLGCLAREPQRLLCLQREEYYRGRLKKVKQL